MFGKQHVSKTTDQFKSRWNNDRSDIRKTDSDKMKNVQQKF